MWLDEFCSVFRMLRKYHSAIGERVLGLMTIDAVRYSYKWVATIKEIQSCFAKLEAEGFSHESQRAWRQHWDYQIYKALNYQYSKGLHDLNGSLREVNMEQMHMDTIHRAFWGVRLKYPSFNEQD